MKKVRVFKGKGFKKNFLPSKADKLEAQQFLLDYGTNGDGSVIVAQRENNLLVIDDKYVRHLWMIWEFWGPQINENRMERVKVKEVIVSVVPTLSTGSSTYTTAGALTSGIAGAVVGSVIDSIKGAPRKDVYGSFEFKDGSFWGSMHYNSIFKPRMKMTSENYQGVIAALEPQVSLLRQCFSSKVRWSH